MSTEPESAVKAIEVEEEVQWVAKQLDLPDEDDSDYGSDADHEPSDTD